MKVVGGVLEEVVWEFKGEIPKRVYKKSSTLDSGKVVFSEWSVHNNMIIDSTVLKVLGRNSWDNMAVIVDATGSMSPYTAQLLVWLQLKTNVDKVDQFTFFNDGDRMSTESKVIGETGGIYTEKVSSFEGAKALLYQAMRAGCGGDSPENDIEALLEALDDCQTCEEIVLIADNFADMRDYKLLRTIKKPIRIIMCGAYGKLNTQYLNLARSTGGSIHTIEEDIDDLVDLNEGETLEVGADEFKIIGGEFVEIERL